MPIKISIDLRLIDRSRCKKTVRRTGDPATFCDIVLWETPDDKFGNEYRVVQDLGKEARESGEKGAILGNGKNFGTAKKPEPRSEPPAKKKPPADPDLDAAEDSEIPF